MKSKNIMFSLLLLVGLALGCKNSGETLLPPSNGKLSHILVVMEANKWKNAEGDTMRAVLRHFYPSLPQDEDLFDISQIPKEALSNIFKRNKNILICNISRNVKKTSINVTHNIYASPQIMVTINAKNSKDFIHIFGENSKKITNVFQKEERNRLISIYTKLKEKKVTEPLKTKFGINLSVPPGFQIYDKKENFMWIRRETDRLTQAILVWRTAYKDTSQLSPNGIIAMRDSITMENIPGPVEGSFMTTEKRAPFDFTELTLNNHYVAEIRGLWRVEGAFMGGPFISHSIVNEAKGEIITVDVFVYAGKQNKRNYVKQMEAILYSLKLNIE